MKFPGSVRYQRSIVNHGPLFLIRALVSLISLTLISSGVMMPAIALAQGPPPPPKSLKDVPTPEPANLADFIKDKQAAITLGKALFWDMQVGSDSVQACASCHSKAGADGRTKNQISPGLNATPNPDTVFGNPSTVFASDGVTVPQGLPQLAPNYTVKAADFPFHSRNTETDPVPRTGPLGSPTKTPLEEFANVVQDCNDVVSSQGVRLAQFMGLIPGSSQEANMPTPDPVFHVGNKVSVLNNVRRCEPRNTPTMINAVFNADNFWDGRASMVFNGVNAFGFRDRTSTLKKNVNGTLTDVFVRIPMGSLASQAVTPPLTDFEMSFTGRDFPSVGRKMLQLRPLALQLVHPQDSVLGPMSRATLSKNGKLSGSKGLNVATYADLIKKAFKDEWWNSPDICSIQSGSQYTHMPNSQDPRTFIINLGKALIKKYTKGMKLGAKDYTQMEYNFSLFFGLAVQLYEATLVADDTPFDQYNGADINYRAGGTPANPKPISGDSSKLSANQLNGLAQFNNLGCVLCHALPETTEHTIRNLQVDADGVPHNLLKYLPDGFGGAPGNPTTLPNSYIDFGMRNIAHRPSAEDIGRAGTAPTLPPFINPSTNAPFPLSYTELWKLKKAGNLPTGDLAPGVHDVTFYVGPDPTAVIPIPGIPKPVNDKSVTRGCFKVPNLRNGALTGGYMHDGTYSTLRQVVQFYARGANFPNTNFNELALGLVPIPSLDPGGSDPNAEQNIKDMVDFLANGLTDQRVVYQRAPFDHPQLFIPNGALSITPLIDQMIEVPAVGQYGSTTPLPTFLGLDPQAKQ